jgi:HD-GYP domain-containing protein (c-di-GMP phosphodiesterase class II)
VQDIREYANAHKIKQLHLSEGFVSCFAAPLIAKGKALGVLNVFHRSAFEPDRDWLSFLEVLANQAAIAIDNATLFEDLQRSNAQIAQAYDTTLEGWVRTLELRDGDTESHTQRVTELTMRLARLFGLPPDELERIYRGALLHDIGKMGIPDSILHKNGPLTPQEREVIRRHPNYALELLSPIPYLNDALTIPYCHHERWDGSGYPRGLKGEEIPLSARLFAVADVWDALRSNRPYRSAWPEAKALRYLKKQAGRHFDPRVVAVFLESGIR